jgi:rod shape-determining protein MreD
MTVFFFILFTFFLALLQAVFLPVNLLILLVLAWAAFHPPRSAFFVAFFAGLFFDLTTLGRLGSASLVFLFFTLLLILYRRRFDPNHPLFLPLFVTLCSLAFHRSFFWLELFILISGGFLWRLIHRALFARFTSSHVCL